MKRILEISDSDLGLESKPDVQFKARTTARAIVRKNGNVALLKVGKYGYYQLPGGGVQQNETIENALMREVFEETGCKVTISEEVGEIVEHKTRASIVQTSHCFIADVLSSSEPKFTSKERKEGFELVWVPVEEAICLMRESTSRIYDGKFIIKRDLEFLIQAKKVM